jgi:hypothetical protein
MQQATPTAYKQVNGLQHFFDQTIGERFMAKKRQKTTNI